MFWTNRLDCCKNHSQKILLLSKSKGRRSWCVFTLKDTIFKFCTIRWNCNLDNSVGFLQADIPRLFSIVARTKFAFSGVVTVTLLPELPSCWLSIDQGDTYYVSPWYWPFLLKFLNNWMNARFWWWISVNKALCELFLNLLIAAFSYKTAFYNIFVAQLFVAF